MHYLSTLLILFTISFPTHSQSDLSQSDIKLNHIGTEQGLPYHRIAALVQDKQGFLWIATETGAIRYDGLNFKLYPRGPEEYNSQNPGTINSITVDSSGEVWVGGSSDYLYVYDRDHDYFRSYLPDPKPPAWFIIALYGDSQGNIWIGTIYHGLIRFDIERKEFIPINQELNRKIPEGAITRIIGDRDNSLWFSDPNGLYRLDRSTNETKYFPLRENLETVYNDAMVKSLHLDAQGTLWIATLDGIYLMEANSETPSKLSDTISEPINCIGEPREGVIWAVANQRSFYSISRNSADTPGFSIVKKYVPELQDQNITTFYQGYYGDFWIGTMNNGFFHTSQQFKAFTKYQSIFDKRVYEGSMTEQDGGQIMMSTGAGITLFEPTSGRFSKVPFLEDLPSGRMVQHPDGWIWCAGWLGLYKFHPPTKKVVQYTQDPENPNSIQGVAVPAILIDRKGSVWVGVWAKGLYRYRPETDDFEHHSLVDSSGHPHSGIWDLFEDKKGNIWVGANGGSVKLRPDKTVDSYFDFHAYSFFEDEKEWLWVASGSGLICINLNSGEVKKWSSTDGLPNHGVRNVLGDNHGFLWLGTNNGLSKFDPETEEFLNFDIDDGLPGNRVGNICLKSESGELYFSFRDGGILRFHPDSIKLNPVKPEIVITQVDVNNQVIPYYDQRFEIRSPGNSQKHHHIRLGWKENNLTIEFAALSHVSARKNQFKYRLENYNREWTYTDQKRPYATYTNLDPGDYTFTVIGSNNDGIWNEEGVSLSIDIIPPIWWNFWSKTLYGLIIISLLWFVRKYEKKREQLKYSLKVVKVKAEKTEEISALRSRFFTNISHEIRTPLTLILGPVNELMERNKKKDHELLKLIQGNAYRLLNLMNQLLDISKIDSNALPLQALEMDLVAFVRSVYQIYNTTAETRDMQYTFTTNRQELKVYFDPEKLEKVLVNLLGNAFKFTPDHEKIELQLLAGDKEVFIKIIDQGIGIPDDQLSKVFDRFYQVDNSMSRSFEGSGIGLSLVKELVELHHGTIAVSNNADGGAIFSIILLLGKDHLATAEIAPAGSQLNARSTISGMITSSEPALSRVLAFDDDLPLLLIVEDNHDMRTYLRNLLSSRYRLIELPDGIQALETAKAKIPDLIICDVMMPGITGFELCDQLKTETMTCHIPVILLTAKADIDSRIEGLGKGADAYLSKPFEKEELLTTIKSLMDLRKKLRERFQWDLTENGNTTEPVEKEDVFIRDIRALILENLSDPDFSIPQICRKMGISRAQLYRKMTAITNDSVGNFILSVRLREAEKLLKTSGLNISEVAYEVGFRDPAYFSRVFKKMYHASPSEIR